MPFAPLTRSVPAFSSFVPNRAHAPASAQVRPVGPGLLARCREWLNEHHAARALRELEPRLARDIGAPTAGCDGAPGNFMVDPRPLWGIGLTPAPMDTLPRWTATPRAAAQSSRSHG
jgi:hypothetical protein